MAFFKEGREEREEGLERTKGRCGGKCRRRLSRGQEKSKEYPLVAGIKFQWI